MLPSSEIMTIPRLSPKLSEAALSSSSFHQADAKPGRLVFPPQSTSVSSPSVRVLLDEKQALS